MTDTTIKQIAEEAIALAAKATPRPWKHVGQTGDGKFQEIASQGDDTWHRLFATVETDDCDYDMGVSNAKLIAHAGTHYGTLARAVLDQAAEIERLRGALVEARTALLQAASAMNIAVLGGFGAREVARRGKESAIESARTIGAALAAKHTREPGP